MRRKIKLKKRFFYKQIKFGNKFIIYFIGIALGIVLLLSYINKKVSPLLISYANTEVKRLSNLVINQSISQKITNDLKLEDLFIIEKENSGEIGTIDFNPITVNKMLSVCTSNVQLNLKYLEKGMLDKIDISSDLLEEYDNKNLKKGVIYKIPSGIIFDNVMLSNLGPKIPVRLNLVGDIESNIHTKITNYGINSALVEVFITIKVNEQVILPFTSKIISISSDIPVAIKLINGKIPNSYFGGVDKSSVSFSLPAS